MRPHAKGTIHILSMIPLKQVITVGKSKGSSWKCLFANLDKGVKKNNSYVPGVMAKINITLDILKDEKVKVLIMLSIYQYNT